MGDFLPSYMNKEVKWDFVRKNVFDCFQPVNVQRILIGCTTGSRGVIYLVVWARNTSGWSVTNADFMQVLS